MVYDLISENTGLVYLRTNLIVVSKINYNQNQNREKHQHEI